MSKKKKFPPMWRRQWFEVSLYEPVGLLRRRTFFVLATTYRTAEKTLKKRHPTAKILSIGAAR